VNEPSAIHIIFDGPPSHEAPRFVEVENPQGRSIRIGEWEPDPRPEYAGQWRLRITFADMLAEAQRQHEGGDFAATPELPQEG
jgi:hypothetical protein